MEDLLRSETTWQDVRRTGRLLIEEVKRPWQVALGLGALTLGEVSAQVGVAVIGKTILDQATGPSPEISGWLIGGAACLAMLAFFIVRARHIMQEKVALACRTRGVDRLSRNIHRAGYEDLAAVPMAALREILMTDVRFAYRFFVEFLSQSIIVLFWLLASVALMAWLSPALLGLMVVLGLAFALVVGQSVRKHMELTGPRFLRLAELSQRARDMVEVDRIILSRQFGVGDLFVRLFMQAHEEYVEIALEQGRLTAVVRSSLLMLNSFSFLAVVSFGGVLLLGGSLTSGGLVAALFVVGQFLAAVSQMSDHASRAAETATAGKRLSAYWNAASTDSAAPASEQPPPIERLEAHAVSFRYESGPPVLHDVSVALRRGRLTALTAETGAGKSTLALVLAGLLPPYEGRVVARAREAVAETVAETAPSSAAAASSRPEEHTATACAPEALASGRVLYVGTKPILMAGSVRDNLFLKGDETPSAEELRAFFADLVGGSAPFPVDEAIIGPNGTGVSSGQAQLIQLVRAVWREPDVVIFDEATSALDMDTEATVQEHLMDWCRRRICLVISHRRCPWTEQADQRFTL